VQLSSKLADWTNLKRSTATPAPISGNGPPCSLMATLRLKSRENAAYAAGGRPPHVPMDIYFALMRYLRISDALPNSRAHLIFTSYATGRAGLSDIVRHLPTNTLLGNSRSAVIT